MSKKVAVYCCNYLYGEGIALILEDIPGLTVSNCLRAEDVGSIEPDLVIADFRSILQVQSHELVGQGAMLMLLEISGEEKNEEDFIASFIGKGLVGILAPNTNTSIFQKAVRGVCMGELWIGRKRLKNIISEGGRTAKDRSALTEREAEVVKMVCKGYRNKEIMQSLNVSEQAVKSHLHRIFRKVGVSDRLQLALYFMKHSTEISN